MGSVRCSRCEKVGHNKRTCGQHKKYQQTKHKLATRKFESSHTLNNVNSAIIKLEKDTLERTPQSAEGSTPPSLVHNFQPQPAVTVEEGGFSLEELETLWTLTNGKTQKGKSFMETLATGWKFSDTEELFEFVNNAHLSEPNTTKKVWGKFFENFTVAEINSTLNLYANEDNPHRNWTTLENLPSRDTIMPEVLFHTFTEGKSSLFLKMTIAAKKGLPPELQTKLVYENEIEILESLTLRADLQPETMLAVNSLVLGKRETLRDGHLPLRERGLLADDIRLLEGNLAVHPHTPQWLKNDIEQRHPIITPTRGLSPESGR